MERELEELLPAKAVKELKNNPIIYIGSLVVAFIMICSLAGFMVKANNLLEDERNTVAGLNIDLTKKSNELEALQKTLSQTEEGKKQIEQAKAQVDEQNKQLDTRATNAEQTASKAKTDLAKTQSDLSKKQAELIAKQTELASINTQLAKAQRGVAKFNQTETLFNSYDTSSKKILGLFLAAYDEILDGNYSNTQSYLDQLDAEIPNNKSIYNEIKAIFDSIKSGNY